MKYIIGNKLIVLLQKNVLLIVIQMVRLKIEPTCKAH